MHGFSPEKKRYQSQAVNTPLYLVHRAHDLVTVALAQVLRLAAPAPLSPAGIEDPAYAESRKQ